MHSFRHSMRDRLRAIECPEEAIDQIGGWSQKSVGRKYGAGYSLEMLENWMNELKLTDQEISCNRRK